MKPSFSCAVVLCLYPTFTAPVLAQDFLDKIRPVVEFENIPLTNGSIQHSIAIETKSGLLYTFQSSDDLISWNDDAVYYSLGQKLTHALRESTPPPPPDPEAPPAPAYPSAFATLLVQPSSGTSGGTVVSWRSLDDGNAVTYHIAGNMDPAWQLVPMIVCDYDNHQFFFSHPPSSVAPPPENPTLGERDATMIAVLEDCLDEINQSLINSVYHTQHLPAPAPTAGQRRFLRVKATAVDTDGDNVTDFDEFLLAAENNPLGNAFNPDADGNGAPDNTQVDTDKDGQFDADDATPSDGTAAYTTVPYTRYALFEIPHGAFQINDQGIALYPTATWQGGSLAFLHGFGPQNGQNLTDKPEHASGINDSGLIIGQTKINPDGPDADTVACAWFGRNANRAVFTNLTENGQSFRTSYNDEGVKGFSTNSLLGPDGRFAGMRKDYLPGTVTGSHHIWTLAGNPAKLSTVPAPSVANPEPGEPPIQHMITGFGPDGLMWGAKAPDFTQGIIFGTSAASPPTLSYLPRNVIPHTAPNGKVSTFVLAPDGLLAQSRVYLDNQWKDSTTYLKALDIALDGSAIGRNHDAKVAPILQNGKWLSFERNVPDVPVSWKDGTTRLIDISPGGWILGERGDPNNEDQQSGVMLPLRVQGSYQTIENGITTTHHEAAGVDDFSIGSPTPDLHPDNLHPVKEKIWVMAPLGGPQKTITISAPLNANTPLRLSGAGIKFDDANDKILTASQSTFAIKAEGVASGAEIPLSLHFDNSASATQPVAFKVMKARTVRVAVYNISKKTTTGSTVALDLKPTQAAITRHLDELYGPQINVTFEVTYHDAEIPVAWDTNGDHKLNDRHSNSALPFEAHSEDELKIIGEAHRLHPLPIPPPNIEVYIVASDLNLLGNTGNAYGFTKRNNRICWIMGSKFGDYKSDQNVIDTLAHEIGHIFFGYGHPNSMLPNKGQAPLKDTDHKKRLMREGPHINLNARLTVKAEWDESERWLEEETE